VSNLEEYFQPAAAAKRLNVSIHTVRKWMRSGKISPVLRPSKTLTLIPASSITNYLASING
jgi:predicted site-specific integrase-resolvase